MSLKVIGHKTPFDFAQCDYQTEWPPNFIGQNVQLTGSSNKAVISNEAPVRYLHIFKRFLFILRRNDKPFLKSNIVCVVEGFARC